MKRFWYRASQFISFYFAADTVYQVHSPFLFEWVNAVLEDRRWYYAFSDIEAVRRKMLESEVALDMLDFGAGGVGKASHIRQVPLRRLARASSSGPLQGRWLFRLVQWLKPERLLELGGGVGVGAMYLAAGAPRASLVVLEGSESCAQVCRANLDILGLAGRATIQTGPFSDTLAPALKDSEGLDLVFIDGDHRQGPTWDYFEQCLPSLGDESVVVLDDIYWSQGMQAVWKQIQQDPRVTLTIDCFDLAFVFFRPEFKSKQHVRLVPSFWKPWKRWLSPGR